VGRVAAHGDRPAIIDPDGPWSFADLDGGSTGVAGALLGDQSDLAESRVALFCRPGREYSAALLGCWRAGGLAVPLHPDHPAAELDYAIADADVGVIVASPAHEELAEGLAGRHGLAVIGLDDHGAPAHLPTIDAERQALMLYTSGTTGRPKGVVHTHRSIIAQIESLVAAWQWSPDDRILLVLPLHHVHGIVNVVCCALWAGAVCEAPGGFDAAATWERLSSGELTLFMAVPTIYSRLITAWDEAPADRRARWSSGAAGLRLMVSGSAALPVSTLDRWREITGHTLLERYGMTEIGMGLSNTLAERVPGHVGAPLPGITVRLVDDAGTDVADGEPGELLVRGSQLFSEYWRRPEETAKAFVDGWFRTGDVAAREPTGYRILGRSSVDIIKTGGEKVSALEIEETYREHPDVHDCAVVGIVDAEWGERVCAAMVPRPGRDVDASELRAWGKERLANYKVPTRFVVVEELPRNAMGKVTKPAVADLMRE
jgi:malonyl-CoA/methylmalonyl-CoA synthetase